MHRFFCVSSNILGNKIIIDDKKGIHHIRDVLRLKLNDSVVIFDEKGNEYDCIIIKISSKITLDIRKKRLASNLQGALHITVACAIPKQSKMEEVIDKLTQLGVERIIPLKTKRVVIKLDKPKEILRHKRWERIALSASLQSQRNTLPIIDSVKEIKQVLSESADFDLKLIPTLSDRRQSLKEIFTHPPPKNILVLIGPEGDFTDAEVDLAKKAGCIPVSLGNLVLRVDTAAIAVASFIRLYAES